MIKHKKMTHQEWLEEPYQRECEDEDRDEGEEPEEDIPEPREATDREMDKAQDRYDNSVYG